MSDYRQEFPDFPASDMPAIPAGFEDRSWHNDGCPSFVNQEKGLAISIDFADPQNRECEEGQRFMVYRVFGDGSWHDDPLLETDEWSEVEAIAAAPVIGRLADRFAIILRSWATTEQWKKMQDDNAKKEPLCCHSHDFCDANMAMDQAWKSLGGSEIDCSSSGQVSVLNAAWDEARERYFTAPADVKRDAFLYLLSEARDWVSVMCGERPSLDEAYEAAEAVLNMRDEGEA